MNLCRVPEMQRKRRGPRTEPLRRVNVEFYPDEEVIVREAKADAARRDQTFRDWVVEAFRQRLEASDAR